MEELCVCGDGNCGFYALLASDGKMEHCLRERMGTPSSADYNAQDAPRQRCAKWLKDANGGAPLAAYQHESDMIAQARAVQKDLDYQSRWSPSSIDNLSKGKKTSWPNGSIRKRTRPARDASC